MKILVDRNNKTLLCQMVGLLLFFFLCCLVTLVFVPGSAVPLLPILGLVMGCWMLAAVWRHLSRQQKILEQAVKQIRQYEAGQQDTRIDCDDEGEMNRLFHEVNTLAGILNAPAEQEKRAKGWLKDTLSDISHQLKTPLAALNIYNGILQDAPADADTVRQFSALSEQELDRIETLVQNLLKIARLDAGTVVLEMADHNLAELLDRIEQRFAFSAKRQGTNLSFCGDDPVFLRCDPVWMAEAIGNIVKNALDHTGAGDTVTVNWHAYASMVQIVVGDSGSGIHPEDLPHIFKRFYRSRFSQDSQGVGLGLALAKAVVEAHGGTIEVNSAPGAGTTFTISFLIPTKL